MVFLRGSPSQGKKKKKKVQSGPVLSWTEFPERARDDIVVWTDAMPKEENEQLGVQVWGRRPNPTMAIVDE